MPKIKPTEAEIALNRETERMKQVAAHHCGAFIELSRGVEQGVVRDGRPGKQAVASLLGMLMLQRIELDVLKAFAFDSIVHRDHYTGALTNALAESNKRYAEDINGNKLGLLASFAFAPVADPEPKEVDDDGGS